jgi:hypothetical protein
MDEKKHNLVPSKKKPVTQIYKRPIGERMADWFGIDEMISYAKQAADGMARKYVYELAIGMIHKLLFKDSAQNGKTPYFFGSTTTTTGMINYNSIVNQPKQIGQIVNSQNMSWPVVTFTTQEDAASVLENLIDRVQKTGTASMNEYYDDAGQPQLRNGKGKHYGWNNAEDLFRSSVSKFLDTTANPPVERWIIQLPNPIKIE